MTPLEYLTAWGSIASIICLFHLLITMTRRWRE
jgi:hypothetical protein